MRKVMFLAVLGCSMLIGCGGTTPKREDAKDPEFAVAGQAGYSSAASKSGSESRSRRESPR